MSASISASAPGRLENPLMLQHWRNLTFLHWPYQPDVIRQLLPRQVELDTFDGAAWIGLVPFVVAGLKSPRLPLIPWISEFPETNVRTYVRGPGGQRGVWFFTLEADRLAAVIGARLWYHLPYRWAQMSVKTQGDHVHYKSKKHGPFGSGSVDLSIREGQALPMNDLEDFLTARFRLYTVFRERLFCAEVYHPPWQLHAAEILRLQQNVVEGSGVPAPSGQPLVHYSENMEVRVAGLKRVVP